MNECNHIPECSITCWTTLLYTFWQLTCFYDVCNLTYSFTLYSFFIDSLLTLHSFFIHSSFFIYFVLKPPVLKYTEVQYFPAHSINDSRNGSALRMTCWWWPLWDTHIPLRNIISHVYQWGSWGCDSLGHREGTPREVDSCSTSVGYWSRL